MTKPFASVATMMLMEDGKLLITDPVAKFLPRLSKLEVSVGDTLVPAEREITVQDLLRHTSGFVYGGFTPNAKVKDAYARLGVDWAGVTPEEQIDRLAK